MRKWYEFLRSLETEGGAIVVLTLLILLFVVLSKFGIVAAEQQIPILLGAILGLLKGLGDNFKDRHFDKGENDNDSKPKVL